MNETEALRIVGGIGADEEYWSSLARGVFVLPRCESCKAWMWPAHFRCGICGSWEQEWIEVDPLGSVFSWTRTWYPFDRVTDRAGELPYVVVLAEIKAAGSARVMGVLEGDDAKLKIGAPVEGRIVAPEARSKGYPSIHWVLR